MANKLDLILYCCEFSVLDPNSRYSRIFRNAL